MVARVRWPEPLRWARDFLPEYFADEPCSFHSELMATLADDERRLVARVAPRGHAKSTCAALAYPLWCICERRRRNIVIVTQEAALATQFVRDIRSELENNARILAKYGDLCAPAVENEDEPPKKRRGRRPPGRAALFATNTGITVQAKGTGASFRGLRVGPQRPDLIICDDLEKDELVQSAEGRRKLEHWLRKVVMPALAPEGKLLVLGSIIHYDALLANLCDRQRFPRWDYRVYRAIEAEARDDGHYYRVALWPARWPLEKLDEERARIGTLAFEQEYQANPIDESLRVFPPEWLQRYDESELVAERLVTLMAVDPAAGAKNGDYFALWVGAVDTGSGIIFTRRLSLARINTVQQVRRVLAAYEEWRPVRVGIETTGGQVALKDVLEDEGRKRGLFLPIEGIQPVQNKIARITASSVHYENGTFRLPAVLDPEVESQFLHFPMAKHDDAPDVCAMGIELARVYRRGRAVEGLARRRSLYARDGGW